MVYPLYYILILSSRHYKYTLNTQKLPREFDEKLATVERNFIEQDDHNDCVNMPRSRVPVLNEQCLRIVRQRRLQYKV